MWRIIPGRLRFYSERYNGRPYNNCMIDAAMSWLRWMGYAIADGDDDIIRAATGVPDYAPNGKPQGLTFGQLRRGLDRLLPGAPWTIGSVDESFLLSELKVVGHRGRGRAVFSVAVDTGKLPPYYQRLVGQSYDAGHALAIVAKSSDLTQVYILDPMGRTTPPAGAPPTWTPYQGELITMAELRPALQRTRLGKIRCGYGYKNTATPAPAPGS